MSEVIVGDSPYLDKLIDAKGCKCVQKIQYSSTLLRCTFGLKLWCAPFKHRELHVGAIVNIHYEVSCVWCVS